jgi:hypothetical protein
MPRVTTVVAFLALTACAARGSSVKPPSAAPAPATPALTAFLAEAHKFGVSLEPPPGYTETPVRKNMDMAYGYAIVSADKRIEMRFALRPYDEMPPPMRNLQLSFFYFMTGISNLVRGGHVGSFADPQTVPAAHFRADDARLVVVRWFQTDTGANAFGDGYELCSAVFMHRKGIGDAYSFVLFKDRDAIGSMDEELLHVMRFAPR